jgi:hypothetical protein
VVLDAVDVLRADDFGGDGGVVPAAGPDFEHLVARVQRQQVGHDRHHVRGADRLALADGERAVGVGGLAPARRDELVTWDRPHRRLGRWVEVLAGHQPVDQFVAALLETHLTRLTTPSSPRRGRTAA